MRTLIILVVVFAVGVFAGLRLNHILHMSGCEGRGGRWNADWTYCEMVARDS